MHLVSLSLLHPVTYILFQDQRISDIFCSYPSIPKVISLSMVAICGKIKILSYSWTTDS